jgi:potassium-dependent mechanosensitive channel
MSWRPETGCRRIATLAKGLVILLLLGAAHAGPVAAQSGASGGAVAVENLAESEYQQIEALIGDSGALIEELQTARQRLVDARNQAQAVQSSGQSAIRELEDRIAALGPKPEEGAQEPPEIAARRLSLTDQLGEARVPVVEAQETEARLEQIIADLDRRLLEEFSENLVTRGPSPVVPSHWTEAMAGVSELAAEQVASVRQAVSNAAVRSAVATQLPLRLLLLLGAVALTFHLRARLGDWIERTLSTATRQRTVAWTLALRNLNRIILPTVGAGLLFAALKPEVWAAAQPQASYFGVPGAVWYLIGAGWLGGSLFAPRTANHRVLPLDNVEARAGARIVLYLGLLLACDTVLADLVAAGGLSLSTQAVLYFPLLCIGSVQLLGIASLLRLLRRRIADRLAKTSQTDAQSRGIGLQVLDLVIMLIRIAALSAPFLAAAGFLAAARLLEFPLMQTLGLAGAALVIFDLINKTFVSVLAGPADRRSGTAPLDGGLIPVFVAVLVLMACLPILGLIWGARPADIAGSWRILNDGVTFSGVSLSPVSFFKFLLVFALIIMIVRLVQTILRGTILPRTKLDAGGRNAIIAGVNYLGFGVAALLGISAAGLDLTNLAIVAGALSVGIGFGLQTVVSNFVSGIILLIERPIKEGDWIEVGQFAGYVSGIRVRSTVIETFDKAAVIVPNADLVAGTVLNRTHGDIAGRLIVPVHVSYDTDPRRVEAILMEVVERHPLVLEDPAPAALFMGFGPDGLNFELRCYLRDVNFLLTVRSDMNFDIAARFRREGINIPAPQRDLHIRSADGLEHVLSARDRHAPASSGAVREEVAGEERPGS